eukprot:symbB.v1.2.010562.t1/scaffold691.1/size191848/3
MRRYDYGNAACFEAMPPPAEWFGLHLSKNHGDSACSQFVHAAMTVQSGMIRNQIARDFLAVQSSGRLQRMTSFEDTATQHDCGYCLAPGEKRCCEFEDEGSCQNCCAEHYMEPYCRLNCQRMCRRGIFKNWSGGKINVPVCPVGGPTKAIQSYDLAKVDGKFPSPYLDWKGEKFEKEWLDAHPVALVQ